MTREEYDFHYQKGRFITFRLLRSRGASVDVAEEITQDAWGRGWVQLSQLRELKLILTWVNQIALNMTRNRIRDSKRKPRSTENFFDPRSPLSASIDVDSILKKVCPTDQFLLTSFYIHCHSAEELAQALGISEVAVRLRLMRARRSAKKSLELL